MKTRIITGLALAAAVLFVLLGLPWWAFAALVYAALPIGVAELQRMARPEADALDRITLTLAALVASLWPLLRVEYPRFTAGAAMTLAAFILAIGRLARPGEIKESIHKLSLDALGLLYLGSTLPYVLALRGRDEHGGALVVLVMVITFLGDTGGYVFGKALGKHKLYPRISPKKTIEGVIGGVILGVSGAFAARAIFSDALGWIAVEHLIAMSLIGVLLGVTGDLVESMLKRAADVKDSGTLIPGHGGLLDRVDGLLFVAPFVYLYLTILT
ncbi:phosphatidate cytidylyltransferase [Myxococcota bacterium]|nr:phosphatidate cytidylyltransferase [Myxococcota bacterium]MBU1431208.1 phosphatidate cytidylyltransferase [Myxococcota bacterium]MBU1896801.1 phosphatidate cytidylyltransferase [Myxococcota bacterium]